MIVGMQRGFELRVVPKFRDGAGCELRGAGCELWVISN